MAAFYKVDKASSRCIPTIAVAVRVCYGCVDCTVSLLARWLGRLRSGGPCSSCFVWRTCVSVSVPAIDLLQRFLQGRLWATTVHCVLILII